MHTNKMVDFIIELALVLVVFHSFGQKMNFKMGIG